MVLWIRGFGYSVLAPMPPLKPFQAAILQLYTVFHIFKEDGKSRNMFKLTEVPESTKVKFQKLPLIRISPFINTGPFQLRL